MCHRIVMNVEEITGVARQFGLDQLKPKQIEVISAYVGGLRRFCVPSNWLLVIYEVIYAALPFVYYRIKGNFIV